MFQLPDLAIEWSVPADFPAGAHTVKARGTSGREAEQTLEVKVATTSDASGNPSGQADPSSTTPANPDNSGSPNQPHTPNERINTGNSSSPTPGASTPDNSAEADSPDQAAAQG